VRHQAALAVVFSARRLRHYFQSFTVVVTTDLPIQKVLQKPDVAGRMVHWVVELSEFDVHFEPRGPIKGQVYANFVVKLSLGSAQLEEEVNFRWVLSVDGSSNQQGSGAGVILERPNGLLIEQALRFSFKASNNQAEYETLKAGMLLAKEIGAQSLLVKSDSQLVMGQVTGEYQAKDPQMAAYLGYIQVLRRAFMVFELVHVLREQNARADLLAKLTSSGKGGRQRTVIHETLKTPLTFVADSKVGVHQISTDRERARSHRSLTQETLRTPNVSAYLVLVGEGDPMQVCAVEEGDTWMTPYKRYLADRILPVELEEGKKIKRNSAKYTLLDGELFRHGFTHLILVCVSGEYCKRIMAELHEGICGSHVGGRSLASKVVRAGYYWPTMREDCIRHAQRCKQCQQHADWHKAPPEESRSIYSPWPFNMWGINILGPFPLAIRRMKYMVVAIDYFTKWIEAEPVAQIIAHKVQHFVWRNIVCRFGVPRRLVSNNGPQFASQQLGKLCTKVRIKQVFTSVEHPQIDGQVEFANRILLRGLKRRLEKAKGTWAEEDPRIVWAYHTTPQSTTGETPFSLAYESDAMIPVEIQESSPRFQSFVAEESNEERRVNLDLLDEVREEARIKAEAVKRRMEHKHSSKLKPRHFQVADLVMRKAHPYQLENKMSPKWTDPFRVTEVLGNGAYRLETLEGGPIPQTWNATNLKFYFRENVVALVFRHLEREGQPSPRRLLLECGCQARTTRFSKKRTRCLDV